MQVPQHVPPHLVRDFNFYDMREETDVYAHFRKLHDGPDIFYTPQLGGHWVVTRYRDIEAIFQNAKDFSSEVQSIPRNPVVIPLLEFDGNIHADFRRLLVPFFSPKNIGGLEQVSRDLTVSLIEGFRQRGECEFVAEFTLKMPIMIIMSLLALPAEDTPYLLKISEDIVRSGDPAVQEAAFGRVFEYVATKVIPARRANPGDDIFSAVIKGSVEDGRPVTDEELMGLGSLLVAAGLDTVAGMLGFVTMFLARSPQHRQQLIDDPGLINDALEEMMRRHHIANVARVAANDVEFNGVTIKAGDCVLLPTSCAGIDDQRYPDAMTVDFRRGDKKTLVFGRGAHQCIGSLLARTELRVFLQEWTRRIGHFEIKHGEEPRVVAGKANSVRYLPLTWSV
ncbi:MAG: cytochrome [Deltaproteobacteria bacterium]|nr:cytochrome [Deltaproteobacteria bacterium]